MVKKASPDKKDFPVIPIIIAIIGCCGTVVAALVTGIFGYLTTRTQIDRPVIFTQTAESIPTALPTNTKVSTPTEASFDWESILKIEHQSSCPSALYYPDYSFTDSDKAQWFQDNGISYLRGHDLMYSPLLKTGPEIYAILIITNISDEQDWIYLEKELTISITNSGAAPDDSHILYLEGCGGAGEIRKFSQVSLRSDFDKYDSTAISTGADFYTLEPGEFEIFEMHFTCQSPGFYRVQFNLPISYKDEEGLIPYSGIAGFLCPENARYYVGELLSLDVPGVPIHDILDYEWTGSDYREIP